MAPRWLPLESNPDVMNKYIGNLGVDNKTWKYYDVYGLEPELLGMVPQPVRALLLLFPITDNYKTFCAEEEERLKREKQDISEDLYFMLQTVGNACGTVGIMHSIFNNMDEIPVSDGPLKSFFESTKSKSPEERAKDLESDEGITKCHGDIATEGQTVANDEPVNLHFIALVHKNGHLYELDGRKPEAVNHGPTKPDTFLNDAAVVCRDFMNRDPKLLQFNIIALAKAEVE